MVCEMGPSMPAIVRRQTNVDSRLLAIMAS